MSAPVDRPFRAASRRGDAKAAFRRDAIEFGMAESGVSGEVSEDCDSLA